MVVGIATSAFAQSAETRRLYVAVDGFELNEAAADDALKAGADINWQNDAMKGETMLIMAIKGFKDAKTIKYLLDNGADASIKDDSGKTALEWARQYNIGRDRNGKTILAMLNQPLAKHKSKMKPFQRMNQEPKMPATPTQNQILLNAEEINRRLKKLERCSNKNLPRFMKTIIGARKTKSNLNGWLRWSLAGKRGAAATFWLIAGMQGLT